MIRQYITKQENPEFDIDINNLKKGNVNENIFDFMTKSAFDMQKEQNKKEQIDKYEKMNNEVYTGEVLPVDSEEVKNAIDIDAEKSAKAYYEHKKKEEEIQKNAEIQKALKKIGFSHGGDDSE